ncbi:hypothetical protein [Candidatus Stoquefichus sp. SB1]|uniref:hypothetical protein n=1 Tax=Candidatus Stoquefichus sp. SB1 TaxID=1658109 RepID=UPI00067EFC64|nr:hypothetical protein [Candidatus Stoquefichus sp. SB1]
MNRKDLFSNLIIALLAQGISMILSFFISFILPKMLSVEFFSYWQLFIFYTSYVGFFHFGINDGVYLRYGGKELSDMNTNYIGGQFKILFVIQCIIILISIIPLLLLDIDGNRLFIIVITLIYMVIFNLSNYLGYIFQAANKTKWYSYSVITDKVFFLVSIIVLFVLNESHYKIYIVFYLIGKILCLLFCMLKSKELINNKISNYSGIIQELNETMRVGIKITISSMASMLILGIGRFLIDNHWGIEIFGKISFALSLTSFALAFIAQVSMVFFPILKRIDISTQKIVYETMRIMCFACMPLIYIVIIPAKEVLNIWLPQYADSMLYLSILLPICVFDAKMNMIFNTYFKALRKEKILLFINLFVFILSCILSLAGVYIFNSYMLILISMVFCIMVRSSVSEIYLGKVLNSLDITIMIYEQILALVFVIISLNFNSTVSFIVVIALYLIEIVLFRSTIFITIKRCLKFK